MPKTPKGIDPVAFGMIYCDHITEKHGICIKEKCGVYRSHCLGNYWDSEKLANFIVDNLNILYVVPMEGDHSEPEDMVDDFLFSHKYDKKKRRWIRGY